MSTADIYYVYEYYIEDTDEVFYVGKGKGNRAWTDSRNEDCEKVKRDFNWNVRIVEENLTESEALRVESEKIQEYKQSGHPLTNRTGGNLPPVTVEKEQIATVKYLLFLVKQGVLRMSYADISSETGVYPALISSLNSDDEASSSVLPKVPDNIGEIFDKYNSSILLEEERSAGKAKYLLGLVERDVIRMSQKEMAAYLGLSEQTISQIKQEMIYKDVPTVVPEDMGRILQQYDKYNLSERELKVAYIKYLLKLPQSGLVKMTGRDIAKVLDVSEYLIADIKRDRYPDVPEMKPTPEILATILYEYGV